MSSSFLTPSCPWNRLRDASAVPGVSSYVERRCSGATDHVTDTHLEAQRHWKQRGETERTTGTKSNDVIVSDQTGSSGRRLRMVESQHGLQEHRGAQGTIFITRPLLRVVANAILAWHENHGRGNMFAGVDAVVSSPARHIPRQLIAAQNRRR